ncbi:BTB family protein [Acanthamoeba polyphaga moumouvirus]|uniref:BTB family protein n=2 Tax=Moumouvirus TaxID=3080801 RepID=L7RB66_9VIRU|nr:BTB family protein [Acanthamoeba polyphaga moumouvirus]AEX63168.1 putative BTB_POZ domain-containing protein [Moumouvirus Monve]AGC01674.1 BTB family protein [Acanthamoeba polyphaga moumouvirus]AQN68012.1 BTB family protein [Saudi moumouvirus]
MDDNTIINIKTKEGIIQTYFQTIKLCQPLVDKIENNAIFVDIEYRKMLTLLNYLRGVFKMEKLLRIAYDLKNIGIEIEMNGYVFINVGGKIFCLEKLKLENKFDYFEMFFRRYESLHPDYTSILIDRCPIIFKLILNYHIYKSIRIKPLYIDEDEKHYCTNKFSIKHMDFKHITHIKSSLSTDIYKLDTNEINADNVYIFEEYDIKNNPIIFFYTEDIADLNCLNNIEIINSGINVNTKLHIHNENIYYDKKINLLIINGKKIIVEKTSKLHLYNRHLLNYGTFKVILPKEIIVKEYKVSNKLDVGSSENIVTKKVNESNITIFPNDICSVNFILTNIKVISDKKIGFKVTAEIYFNEELVCKSLLSGRESIITGLRNYYYYKICLPSKNKFKIIFKFPEDMEDKEIMFLCDYSITDIDN